MVAAAVAVLAVAGGGWVVAVGGPRAAYYSARYQADEPAFRAYVAQYVGAGYSRSDQPDLAGSDRAWAVAHPDELVREGRAACSWLADQPRAPRARTWNGPYSYAEVAGRYETFSTRLDPYLSEFGRSAVVAGAWEHLCRAQRLVRVARAPEED